MRGLAQVQDTNVVVEILRKRLDLEASGSELYLPFLLSFTDPGYRLSLMKLVAGEVEHSYRLYLVLTSLGVEGRRIAEDGFNKRSRFSRVLDVRPESKEEALVHAFITRIVSLAHLEQVRATLEPLSSQLNLPLIEKQERLQLTWLENVISGTNLNLRHTLLKYHHLAEELARDLGLSWESTAKVMEKLNDVLGSIP